MSTVVLSKTSNGKHYFHGPTIGNGLSNIAFIEQSDGTFLSEKTGFDVGDSIGRIKLILASLLIPNYPLKAEVLLAE